MGAAAQRNPEDSSERPDKGILRGLFKKFAGKPLRDTVPAGISKRAVMGGKQSGFDRIFRNGR